MDRPTKCHYLFKIHNKKPHIAKIINSFQAQHGNHIETVYHQIMSARFILKASSLQLC